MVDDILYVIPTQKIDYNGFVNFLKEFSSLKDLPKDLKILYDLRQASVHLHLNEITQLSEISERITLNINSVKTAFLIEEPKTTAYSMLYSWIPKSDHITRAYFSTQEAAIKWLNKST